MAINDGYEDNIDDGYEESIDDSSVKDPIDESYTEDFSDIDTDINALYERFITPIENIRSLAVRPSLSLNELNTNINKESGLSIREIIKKSANGITPANLNKYKIETRTHAFYRLLGLPVIAKDGNSFYNPGFNPNANVKNILNVLSNLENDTLTISYIREQDYKDRINILKKDNIEATVFLKLIPFFAPNFQVINKEKKEIFDLDFQSVQLDKNIYDLILNNISNLPKDADLSKIFHVLKPFVVDPLIENTVTPVENIVTAPFLGKISYAKNILISGSMTSTYKTPMIESIIKYRLSDINQSQLEENQQFITNILNSVLLSDTLSDDSILDEELLVYSTVARTVTDLLNKSSSVDYGTFSGSVKNPDKRNIVDIINIYKIIKYLVDLLIETNATLNFIQSKITWQPLTNTPEYGPEGGIFNSTTIAPASTPLTQFETTLYNLNIRKVINEVKANAKGNDKEIGSIVKEKKKDLEDSYQELLNIKNEYIQKSSECLKTIEIISGIFSGIGLIDILAIYSALYALSKKELINLLDNDSFNRLYSLYPEYRVEEVIERYNNKGPTIPINKVIASLEEKIITALDFAEKCYNYNLNIPIEGTPAGSSTGS